MTISLVPKEMKQSIYSGIQDHTYLAHLIQTLSICFSILKEFTQKDVCIWAKGSVCDKNTFLLQG